MLKLYNIFYIEIFQITFKNYFVVLCFAYTHTLILEIDFFNLKSQSMILKRSDITYYPDKVVTLSPLPG